MTPTQNTNAVSLRPLLTDAEKIELLSKHMGVNLNDVLAEETERRRLEGEAERLRQEDELKREIARKLKSQRDYVGNGLLSGQIIAITPKRKFFTDISKFTDADCFKIKEACSSVMNTKSYPIFAQEIHITVEDRDILILCRKSA
jgi:hypothetical protein